jgi:hypothetical protein
MSENTSTLQDRLVRLERSLRRTRIATASIGIVVVTVVAIQFARRPAGVLDEVRTRRLVVVDSEGRMRVQIAQDPENTDRRARSAGLQVFDDTGYERGGFSTFDDGSVVLAMDAPHGVGDPMPDRIGLMVYPDGATHINLLDNQTRAVARLYTEADGSGGLQALTWDMPAREIHIRTLTYDGDQRETKPMEE